ncbi:hypothetical protein [Acetobacter fallax]|uniref:Uncharacterized protein n=1 Tax=Acetobacter fallax TaxID=1737473 RepID=A0ABX0K9R5_9PROT|nr:hypothetical protein [Acetobacter fallax]NHO31938.1 hypothetical protein [Acetobacter fallax]NHO35546.1 hypothetical protein [Acetobacter fallax]
MLIPQHTGWLVLFFGGLGFIVLGARIVGLLAIAALLLVLAGLTDTWLWLPVFLTGRLGLAIFRAELVEWDMRLHGFTQDGVVAGANAASALLRYMDQTSRNGSTRSIPSAGNNAVPDPFAIAAGARL